MTNVAGDPSVVLMLIEHYRCHPQLMYIFNLFFYAGKLICRVDPNDRPPLAGFPAQTIPSRPEGLPDDEDDPEYGGLNSDKATGGKPGDVHRITVIHVDADEVSTPSGGRANLREAEVVVELLRRIAPTCRRQRLSIQVSAPYSLQTGLLDKGAPSHPTALPRKDELRARTYYGKKTDKERVSTPEGAVFTATEGPLPRRAESPQGPPARRPLDHTELFGDITHRQGRDVSFEGVATVARWGQPHAGQHRENAGTRSARSDHHHCTRQL